jgi:hypothetical protein
VALAARPLRTSGVRLAMSPTSRNPKIHYFPAPSIGNLHEFVTRFKVTFCVKFCTKFNPVFVTFLSEKLHIISDIMRQV